MLRKLAPAVFSSALVFSPMLAKAQETEAERTDRGTIVAFIEDNLSGAGRQVILRGFEGALSSRATATQLTIADDQGVWLTVNDIVLDWNRASLLAGALSVNELTAGEIIVARAPVSDQDGPSPEATGFSLPELPVSVSIDMIKADRVVLEEPLIGQEVEGQVEAAVQLSGGQGTAKLNISRTDDGPNGKLLLDAGYDNGSGRLSIDLDAQEAADGLTVSLLGIPGKPSAELKIKGAGPLADFSADISLKTDGTERLDGLVVLKENLDTGALSFDADLGGDLAPLFVPEYADFFGPNVALQATGARAATGALDLSRLALSTRSLDFSGAVIIASDGLPEKIDVEGTLRDPNGGPVVLPVTGDVSLTSANIDIGYDSRSEDRWTARIIGTDLSMPQGDLPEFTLNGSGRIDRRSGNPLIGGTIKAALQGLALSDPALARAVGSDLSLESRFWWESAEYALRIGNLDIDGDGMKAQASGAVNGINSGFRVEGNLRAVAEDLGRFSGIVGREISGKGEVRLTGHGSPLGGDFDAELLVLGSDLGVGIAQADALLAGPSSVELAVVRDPTGTEIRKLEVRTTTLSLDGQGQLDTDRVTGDITFDMRDLSVAGEGYSGTASGRATIDGALFNGRADLTAQIRAQDVRVSVPQADRLLAGTTILDLTGSVTDAALQITTGQLRGANYSATVSGLLSSDLSDLSGQVELADVSVIDPQYSGEIAAQFTARGTVDDAAFTVEASSRDLRLGIPEADALLAGKAAARLQGEKRGNALDLSEAVLTGERVTAKLAGKLDPDGSDFAGSVAVTDLAGVRPGFGGAVSANFSAKGTTENGSLNLTAKAQNLKVGQDQANLLLSGTTGLEASVRMANGNLRIDSAQLSNPQITAKAAGQVVDGQRSVDLDARLTNLALLLPEFPGPVTLRGTASETARGYRVDLSGTGPGQINATVKGDINGDFGSGNLAIQGSAQAGLANPYLGTRVLSGPLSLDMRLNGPFGLSSLSGRASLSNGRMADATLPFSLLGINAGVTMSGGRASIDGSANISTGGSISLKGGIGAAAPFVADVSVIIANATIRDPQLYEARVNGDLRLSGPLTGGAVLSGRIAVPESEIRIASTGLGGVGDIPDLKHVREPVPVRETRSRAGMLDSSSSDSAGPSRPYGLDLTISAPNRLFVRGRGLDAELGGELRVTGNAANVIPSGAFNLIRGRLDILGRRLDLTEAMLQLEGSFDPFIRVVASTVADGITAGVLIEGQATDPKVSFTSSPQLPEEEVLSQILFGKRLESISAFQAVQLASAVATLAGRGGEGIVARLRKGFGLDDFDVQTSDDGTAQLKAGKYLNENLYTEVTVDQDGKSEISLNLDLTDSITVKGRVGTDGDTGLGVFYEKDY